MKTVGRLMALFWSGLMIASVLGTVAARAAKQRIVPLDDADADEIRLVAIFEPLSFRSTATSFRGGTIDCWYGGGIIDLRRAVLDPAGARLQVRAIFGGGQIVVPDSWSVSASVVGLGGLGDGRSKVERPADAPHLTIEGIAIFGGFGVTSELDEAQAEGLRKAIERRADRRRGATEGSVQAEPAI
ncbi:MAG TPA: hypothetical protein VFY18_08260 [Candidatus Limnocylindrales bacterium]|nr:hypothetical protein [Candidatus Limnocylindrales bacterium]